MKSQTDAIDSAVGRLENIRLEVWAGLFEGVLGTLKSLYRVYSRYISIPGLRAHTRGPWVHPKREACREQAGTGGLSGLVG